MAQLAKIAAFEEALRLGGGRLLWASESSSPASSTAASLDPFAALKSGWQKLASTYRPHTRWWWPGNAVTEDGLTWELEQMHQQGIGGVEIMSPWRMYEKGDIDYLSPEFLKMVQHAVQEAKQRDMQVSLSFCPGWVFGGFWVPPEQRSKVLTQSWQDVSGPLDFQEELPLYKNPARNPQAAHFLSDAPDENQIVAVVAGKVSGEQLDAESLIDLTDRVTGNSLHWQIPEGSWKLMVFRLKYTGQECVTTKNFPQRQWAIDHFSKEAVTAYCDYLGGAYYKAFGDDFGKTVDSMFCDSFEVETLPDTILWSNTTLEKFRSYKGYDLARYLPAIWWNIGELTPKVRYDINDFLGWLAIEATFKPFIDWCNRHGTQARIQPHYRFTEEIIQGAGITPRPEMEVTTTRFAVVMNPRKAVAAGAHLYGREIVSAEAFTFLHKARYNDTLEELKIATDAFIRDGTTQLYNAGYLYSPEMQVAPARDAPWTTCINHWSTWWKYYHHLADYTARSCYLMRQGEFAGDILVYSPQATVWTQKVLFSDRRLMPYGDIGQTLVANGYDFDPVNDDILQNCAQVDNKCVKVRTLTYRFIILPRTTAMPVATLEFIRKFVLGGGIVIALHELPLTSVGLQGHAEGDARVQAIVKELFGPDGKGMVHPGGGQTYYMADYTIPDYKETSKAFNPGDESRSAPFPVTPQQKELVDALREHLDPDFCLADNQQSQGLTFLHRRLGADDIYFVTNLQSEAAHTKVTFRTPGKLPQCWDPVKNTIQPVFTYQAHAKGVDLLIDLPPYASKFFLFRAGKPELHVGESNLDEIIELTDREIKGIVSQDGNVSVEVIGEHGSKVVTMAASGIPEPFELQGPWTMILEGYQFAKIERQLSQLHSWTEDPETKYFSGTGRYSLEFQVPDQYVKSDIEVTLDLGQVGCVAEVILNDRPAGVAWMPPYWIKITDALKPGTNHLEIQVTNTLINYVSGLNQLPEVPENLISEYGSTFGTYKGGEMAWKHNEKGFDPLPLSGLVGPVKLVPRKRITLPLT